MNKLLLLFLISCLVLTQNANAETIFVDEDTCTLNDAIIAANSDTLQGGCLAGFGDDTLELPVNAVIVLQMQLDALTSNITINGNNATIQRDPNADTAFPIIGIFNFAGVVNLNDLTITGGSDSGFGAGGILMVSTLHLDNVKVKGNEGGGIFIHTGGAPLSTIMNSEISDNHIYVDNPNVQKGGGITLDDGVLTIENSTIDNNSTVSMNGGGGIYVQSGGSESDLTLTNSTISGNSSSTKGGGLSQKDSMGLQPITIAINYSTFVKNLSMDEGAGINLENATTTITHSLITGNTSESTDSDELYVNGGNTSIDSYNLFGQNSSSGVEGIDIGTTNIVPDVDYTSIVNPNLKYYSKDSQTKIHNLIKNSPAIDVISSDNCVDMLTDQEGESRPLDGDNDETLNCDIGSIEYDYDPIFKDGFDKSL